MGAEELNCTKKLGRIPSPHSREKKQCRQRHPNKRVVPLKAIARPLKSRQKSKRMINSIAHHESHSVSASSGLSLKNSLRTFPHRSPLLLSVSSSPHIKLDQFLEKISFSTPAAPSVTVYRTLPSIVSQSRCFKSVMSNDSSHAHVCTLQLSTEADFIV